MSAGTPVGSRSPPRGFRGFEAWCTGSSCWSFSRPFSAMPQASPTTRLSGMSRLQLPWLSFRCLPGAFTTLFLLVGIYLAIDLPRTSELDIFKVGMAALLRIDDREAPCMIDTMSSAACVVSGCDGFSFSQVAEGHARIELVLTDSAVLGGRIGQTQGEASRIEIESAWRSAATRYLFNGQHLNSVGRASPLHALLRIVRRLLA